MRKRNTTALILSCLFVTNLFCSEAALAARFVDTTNYWAEKYINKLSDSGIIPAAQDGKFRPDDPITRAELAEWMVKVMGLEKTPVAPNPSFPDVKPTDAYFNAVEIMRLNNYISGYPDGFRPKQFIQRGEMISIIARGLNKPRPDDETIEQELSKFADVSKIPQWARQGIASASKEGILVAQYPDKVDATKVATRGETAAILCALSEYLENKNVSEEMRRAETEQATAAQPPGQGGYPNDNQQYQGQVQQQVQQQANMGQPPGSFVPMNAQPGFPPGGMPPMYGGTGQMGGYPPAGMLQGGVATVAAGTAFNGTLKNSLDSGSTQPGEPVELTLSQPVFANGVPVIPAGSVLSGNVTNVVSARRFQFGANGKLDIKFNQCITPDGRRFPLSASIDTNQVRLTGGTTAGRVGKGALTTAVGAGSGAALGTALGAIVGATSRGSVGKATGMGAVFGTAIGGGVGLVGAGVRKGSEVKIPAGSNIPVTVDQTFQVYPGPPMPYGQPPVQMGNPYQQPMQQY